MIDITFTECAQLMDGIPGGNDALQSIPERIFIDSRRVQKAGLFFALPGANVDGHNFIDEAIRMGATGICHSQDITTKPGIAYIKVSDTIAALQALAGGVRKRLNAKVIAITGSNGKTTTKEMINSILSVSNASLANKSSFNNEIGLPLSILDATLEHRFLILEMGMRGKNQIAQLADIAQPDVGVITNIRESHLEFLGTREAIAEAKGELLEKLGPGSIAVLNHEDDYCKRLYTKAGGEVIWFGRGGEVTASGIRLNEEGNAEFTLDTPVGKERITLQIPGECQVDNALAATAVTLSLNINFKDIIEGLSACQPMPMRMEISKASEGWTIINDAYNANPASAKEAIKVLAAFKGERKWAVMGDMKELGESAEQLHLSIGRQIAHSEIDYLIVMGDLGSYIYHGAISAGMDESRALLFNNFEQTSDFLRDNLRNGDVILFKASRAVGLEKLAENFNGGKG